MAKRIIAIDWSGNKQPAAERKHIWMADWRDGIVTLTHDRTRKQTVDAVTDASHDDQALLVGFDFAFAYPAWFAGEQNCNSAPELWELVEIHGDKWLSGCKAPFWGRPSKKCPLDHREPYRRGYRETEREVQRRTKRWPTSPFQIGGAGAVGTGSMRGMPFLLELRKSGFSVWPFDSPRLPMVIEIYPRVFTGRTKVSDATARARHLEQDAFCHLPGAVLAAARNSPDAFDALCALMGMATHVEELAQLRQSTDPRELLEGRIWMPREM